MSKGITLVRTDAPGGGATSSAGGPGTYSPRAAAAGDFAWDGWRDPEASELRENARNGTPLFSGRDVIIELPPFEWGAEKRPFPLTARVSRLATIECACQSIDDRVNIGSFCHIGERSVVGQNSSLRFGVKVGQGVTIGNGAVLRSYSQVADGAKIGKDAICGWGAKVGRDAVVEEGAVLGNYVVVEEGAKVGRSARVGDYNVVTAKSPVEPRRSVPDQKKTSWFG